jgi:hypothetical protein
MMASAIVADHGPVRVEDRGGVLRNRDARLREPPFDVGLEILASQAPRFSTLDPSCSTTTRKAVRPVSEGRADSESLACSGCDPW